MNKKLLQYNVTGSGDRTVVFLHGFLESRSIWDSYASILSADFRCLQIDLPGHGDSPSTREIETMDHMAEDVLEILRKENIQGAKIIGHSMGGYVAIAALASSPENIHSVCLLNSHAGDDSAQKKQDRDRVVEVISRHYLSYLNEVIPNLFAKEKREHHKTDIEELIKRASMFDSQGIAACTKGMRDRPSQITRMQEFGDRLHFIAGSKDTVLPVKSVISQTDEINCSCDIIEGAGHMCYLEEPSTTLRYLHTFLNE